MEISSEDRETLERLEQELWHEETYFDKQRANELIAPDFFEFGRSGRVWQREDTLAAERSPRDAVRPVPEFHIRLLNENIAQVTYDSAFTYDGVVEHTHRSSIWSRTSSGWVLRFHQGTPFQPFSTINAIAYRPPQLGDEREISVCMWAAADLWELTDGTLESNAELKKISDLEELRARILSSEKTLVATWNGIVVGFIAFRRGNHLSLLFVRREFARQGIGRELFSRCSKDIDEITVNASDAAVGFYQKVGFVKSGDRFFTKGIWGTPMNWTKKTV